MTKGIGERIDKVLKILGEEGPCRMSYLYACIGIRRGGSNVKRSMLKLVPPRILWITSDKDPIVMLAEQKYSDPIIAAARYREFLNERRLERPPRPKPKPEPKPEPKPQEEPIVPTMTDIIIASMAAQGALR